MNQSGPLFLGQYRPLDSFLHHLDARAKLLPVVLVLVLSLLTSSMLFYVSLLFVLVLGLLASGIGVDSLWRSFKPVLLLVVITVLYHLLFTGRDTPTVTTLAGFRVTSGALRAAAFYSLRLVLFVAIAFLITLTNSPSELAEAFTKLLRPLRKLRVPINDLALIIFIAIRFIPILYDEFVAIRNAQIVRGVNFDGGFFSRARKTVYLLIPVFVAAINRADELALAIEARGYDGRAPRTFYSRSRLDAVGYAFMVMSAVGIGALYVVTR